MINWKDDGDFLRASAFSDSVEIRIRKSDGQLVVKNPGKSGFVFHLETCLTVDSAKSIALTGLGRLSEAVR